MVLAPGWTHTLRTDAREKPRILPLSGDPAYHACSRSQNAGGETKVKYQHQSLVLPGILLICLFILPAAGEVLVPDCQGTFFCTPQQQSPLSLYNPLSPYTSSSLIEENALKGAPGNPDPSVSAPTPQASSAIGRMSAWVNQHSMQGNVQGIVSEIEYHQMVTASGEIQGFHFSASWVSG